MGYTLSIVKGGGGDMRESNVLTITRAANELGVSAVRVRQLVDAGRIRARRDRTTGWRLISRDALDDFKQKRDRQLQPAGAGK